MTDFPVMYGIWRTAKGWVRGDDSRALMFTERPVAEETAKRLTGCKVFFIDQSLVDIETQLLEAELKQHNLPLFKRIFQTLKA